MNVLVNGSEMRLRVHDSSIWIRPRRFDCITADAVLVPIYIYIYIYINPVAQIRPPDGFELLPGDLASSEESTSEVFSEAGIADQAGGEGEGDNKPNDEEGAEGVENASTKCSAGGDKVFLCVKASFLMR